MDRFSAAKRSEIMARVKQKDTKPEMIVRRLLHKMGFRFRLHRKNLPGKPDITLPKFKAVVFVHGCYWHGHNCQKGRPSETRKEFWAKKIFGNRKRDQANITALQKIGYRVLVVWECETRNKDTLAQRMTNFLKQQDLGGTK